LAKPEKAINRILVAVDASPQSQAALQVAVDLAARVEAELVGIFVEDVNLLRIASLPTSREISFYTTTLREIDSPSIERQLRAQARLVQRLMARIAARANVRWSFRVVRGAVSAQLLAATMEADLVIIGKSGWTRGRRMGSTARVLVVQSTRPALVLQRRIRFGLPVVVVYDGSVAGKKALAGADLVATRDSLVTILILAEDPEEVKELRREAHTFFMEREFTPQYHWVSRVEASDLIRIVKSEGCGVLILPTGSERLPDHTILETVDRSECAVLLVR
jgi:nucleotide-binding universal stress UspA family protein